MDAINMYISTYLEAEKLVRDITETLGLDAELVMAKAERLARETTLSTVEALHFVVGQVASGKYKEEML